MSYEGSYEQMADDALAAKKRLKKRLTAFEVVTSQALAILQDAQDSIIDDPDDADIIYPRAMTRAIQALSSVSSPKTPETITTSPAVVKAMADALVQIDSIAPQQQPEEPDYEALTSPEELYAACVSYGLNVGQWVIAKFARQALTFVQLANAEPAAEDDTVKLEAQS